MHDGLLRQLIVQLRTRNALPPVVALLTGYALFGSASLDNSKLAATTVAIICIMFFFTLQNDVVDAEEDTAGGRAAPLNQGTLNITMLTTWYKRFLLASLVFSLATKSWTSILLITLLAVLAWQYNKPPLEGSHRPAISIIELGLILSTLPLLIGWSVAGKTGPSTAAMLIAGLFLVRVAVSILKDYKDHSEDMLFGKKTFLIHHGPKVTNVFSLSASVVGYCLVAIALLATSHSGLVNLSATTALTIALYSTGLRLRLGEAKANYKRNAHIFQRLFDCSVYFDMAVLACLLIS